MAPASPVPLRSFAEICTAEMHQRYHVCMYGLLLGFTVTPAAGAADCACVRIEMRLVKRPGLTETELHGGDMNST